MRWGLGSKLHQRETQHPHEPQQESKGGKSKAAFSSFSPLAWLPKLTAKNNAAAAKLKHAPPAPNNTAGGFPSCVHNDKPASPSPASQSSPAESSPAAAARDIKPRRLSVGNDDAEVAAAGAPQLHRRRHYSVGGDRDLLPLSHLIPFSRAASLQRAPAPEPAGTLTPMPPRPSDSDGEKRPRSRRLRRRGAGRRSFSGRTPGARVAVAVRVRSPCRAAAAATAVSELERFAVVRRTRDPQREFRQSMVDMIASKRIGRPEELETLLACYLSLNADEHHDCIVKVFRQVWFELNPAQIAVPAPLIRRRLHLSV